jgi:hypothetical protein
MMKTVKQLSVSLPNKPGMLSKISDVMGVNGVNIIGLYVRTIRDEGVLSFVANDPERALNVLKLAGYEVKEDQIIACETPHHPGGLNAILKPLKEADVNVEYLYSYLGSGDHTVLLLGIDKLQAGINALERNWIRLYGDELYSM